MLSPHNIPSTGKCSFPLCKLKIDRGNHCVHHAKYFEPPREKKARTVLKKVSEKRKVEQKEYVKIVKEKLGENPNCEIKSPVCMGRADGLDHIQKRSPKNFIDRNNLKNACSPCNLYKELNPKWAIENGHSISRFKK